MKVGSLRWAYSLFFLSHNHHIEMINYQEEGRGRCLVGPASLDVVEVAIGPVEPPGVVPPVVDFSSS